MLKNGKKIIKTNEEIAQAKTLFFGEKCVRLFRASTKLALIGSFLVWAMPTFCRLVFFVQRVACVSVSDYVLRVFGRRRSVDLREAFFWRADNFFSGG